MRRPSRKRYGLAAKEEEALILCHRFHCEEAFKGVECAVTDSQEMPSFQVLGMRILADVLLLIDQVSRSPVCVPRRPASRRAPGRL